MRNLFFLPTICFFITCAVQASPSGPVLVKYPQIPILTDSRDNVLCYIRIDAAEGQVLNEVVLSLDGSMPEDAIKAVKLYYGGTEAIQHAGTMRFAAQPYISRNDPGKIRKADPAYSVLESVRKNPGKKVVFPVGKKLFPGINYFWVSIEMKSNASLLAKVNARIEGVSIDHSDVSLQAVAAPVTRRLGVGVRQAGDDGAAAFRIPGLVTSNKGTLLGVYDVRYNNSIDLQEHVDVGLSRSTDSGKTWKKMRLPLSFGEYGGLPKSQNGVGDPAILVDRQTGDIWIVAAWTHGMGNGRAWWNSGQGMALCETAQLVMVKSEDDGKTWPQPVNVTSQVKDPSWYFLLQGPGSGISMRDGTLVFASQYIDSTRVPNAGILYSKDHGKTWQISTLARTNTTESQVAEIRPGVLMLNMRDNRGGSRAVSVTEDMGKTWQEHPSSRKALRESVCMASLLHVGASDNVLNRDVLLFSNPDTTKGRNHITIKASLDGGMTWLPEHQVLLDGEEGWGYSCLTMVDPKTVGILYESSVAHMTFQAVLLEDIVGR